LPSDENGIEAAQIAMCRHFGAEFLASGDDQTLGLSRDFSFERLPVHGLRRPPEPGTCGWYIWSGAELSQDEDFFAPIQVSHLLTKSPSLVQYLGLAPGWRFIIAADRVDVWRDASLPV